MADDPFKHLIISRKRKKYKFAHFDSYDNCFNLFSRDGAVYDSGKLWDYLGADGELVVELAAGNGQFSLELARRHPSKRFVAIDIKSDRLYSSARKALAEGVTNVAFVRLQIRNLLNLFSKKSIDTLWITFPDPHPKKRSSKHRLTHKKFLQYYRKILKDTGSLHFKTDNLPLFQWSLEQFITNKWVLTELSFDLHESDLSDDYKIKTYYEEMFTSQGIPTNFVTARK
ncbi:tRNA (guanosine(46)-N7)-methyltransferase TrmB [Candidatus Saccharibacteria bacterium]|nr:tRNA (guanosine(46)-N7)-methyltransferase TrmB [Candidatus Saccharibacteria bacterium]